MSIFSFFSRKKPPKADLGPDSAGLEQGDVTQPLMPGDKRHARASAPLAGPAANPKTERLGQRELLYGVVRDTMTRAGVLTASYKFKVLSLDKRGRQYLIMMDLVSGSAGETARLSEIEAMLAQAAKARHDILVTAVYWRVSEQVTAGLSAAPRPSPPVPQTEEKPVSLQPRLAAGHAVSPPPGYEPLQQDEIAAFKRAIASGSPPGSKAPGQVVTSGRRNPRPPVEFEDTQISPTAGGHSPLSATQYGDLN